MTEYDDQPSHGDSDRRLDFSERRRADRREADAIRMEWLRRTNEEQRAIRSKFDEVLKNQDAAKRQHEQMLQRIEIFGEALGIDERGHHVRGGIAETFAKLSGLKMALVWAAGGIIAVMGLYSTIKEVGQRWLGH